MIGIDGIISYKRWCANTLTRFRILFSNKSEHLVKLILGLTDQTFTIGAVFLAGIAILPVVTGRLLGVSRNVTYFFGGTATKRRNEYL